MMKIIDETHDRTKLLLDATPLSTTFWDKDGRLFDCNEEAVKMYKLKDKQEYIQNFYSLAPEHQPNGQPTVEVVEEYFKKAFAEGECVFEYMHQLLDGTPIPTEVTLKRVMYEGEFALAGYSRDLREYKKTMNDIQHRDMLLTTGTQVAGTLLQSEQKTFTNDVWHCMDIMAHASDVDRMYVWEKSTMNGKLYCMQIYEWSENAEPQQGNANTQNLSYDEVMPSWED
jgi:hypothetical protein